MGSHYCSLQSRAIHILQVQVRNGVGVRNCTLQVTESKRIAFSKSLASLDISSFSLDLTNMGARRERETSFEFILHI